jgi:hypothetical protein
VRWCAGVLDADSDDHAQSIPGGGAGTIPIAQMSADDIRSAYVLYIGAVRWRRRG